MRWAYGVTTVPSREEDLLPRTLISLCKAGFDRPRLFVDGERNPAAFAKRLETRSPLFADLEVTARSPKVRTHGNWVMSLYELYIREPAADRYAVFQDDFVTYANLRGYLEACAYSEKTYLNLYTFQMNEPVVHGKPVGWYESKELESPKGFQGGRGAVALVFNRDAVLTLLSSRHMVERPLDCDRGWRTVDGGIVTAMNKEGYREMIHNPSLVQHTGIVSSMGSRQHRLAETWRGEDFDALEFLK